MFQMAIENGGVQKEEKLKKKKKNGCILKNHVLFCLFNVILINVFRVQF